MSDGPPRLRADLLDAAVELMGRAGRGGAVLVHGRSMEPTLVAGQRLAVEFAPERLRAGDMLLFRQVDYLVVHRMLGRARRADGSPYYRMRGDALPGFDPPVDPERVVGRVIAFELAGQWRGVRARPARVYARLLAAHALFWTVVRLCAGRVEALLARVGARPPLREWGAALDRRLLRGAHAVLFSRVHPPVAEPAETGAAEGHSAERGRAGS